MALGIRRARSDDAGGISSVKIAAWRNTYAHIIAPSVLDNLSHDRTQSQFEALLTRDDIGGFVVIDEDSSIVGYAIAGFSQVEDPPEIGEIQSIYLLPQAQGSGFGTRLMLESARWLADHGYVSATVWAFRNNERAIAFYRSLGAEFYREAVLTIDGVDYEDHCHWWPHVEILVDLAEARISNRGESIWADSALK